MKRGIIFLILLMSLTGCTFHSKSETKYTVKGTLLARIIENAHYEEQQRLIPTGRGVMVRTELVWVPDKYRIDVSGNKFLVPYETFNLLQEGDTVEVQTIDSVVQSIVSDHEGIIKTFILEKQDIP